MHPAGAAAAGGAVRGVRAVARANIILGLAMAAMALVTATINPGDFHAQIIEQAAPATAPGAQGCAAATEAEALGLRGAALDLVLMGVVQAVLAAAADVAVAGSLRRLGRCVAALAHLTGALNTGLLCYVVNRAAVVTMGNCVTDLSNDVAFAASGKQRRKLRRAGRRPARIGGPEWTR
ncbi:uncharacterized protein [Lolium perenne]|uniref:uncharacterized protein isoform X2 n=1 Tax=Lolium perenne TaxID=4522 RepID=UPI003A998BAE